MPTTSTLPSALWLDLLGKPFRAGARGPDAYDCEGLLLTIQFRLGRAVPDHHSDAAQVSIAKLNWEPVAEADAQPGDAILLRSTDPLWHVGVVCGAGWMIHAESVAGVVRERYDDARWHKRVEGFYRWKKG
jgi:cell wall-associated NlpC family hydrolase